MTMVLSILGAVIGAAVGVAIANVLGLTPPLAFVVVAPMAILGVAAWMYSPLPDNNGGIGSGSMNTDWGWSSDE